jgi:hypothetical protein
MKFVDFTIELSEGLVSERGDSFRRHEVRVLQAPIDDMRPEDAVSVEYDEGEFLRTLGLLERRELDREGLIALGRTLAALLLPIGSAGGKRSVREILGRSLLVVPNTDGVRLRLRLPRELASVPWEYTFVERAGGEGMDGFLALDPRIAIVRHEAMGTGTSIVTDEGPLKIVAAFASAEGLPELDLGTELQNLKTALADIDGVLIESCEKATLEGVQQLLPGAAIFHFAGHGDFTRVMGARPGTFVGTGLLAFEDKPVHPEQLSINLRSNGVRLAVLAGCQTGRREGVSVWSGIAPALVKGDIPAVVANQYTITDKAAIAFSRRFYQALAGGAPVERAVTAGRIAIYNQDQEGRDWGVPVLYLRAGSGELFAGVLEPSEREHARKGVEADVIVRTSEIKAGGVVYGANVVEMLNGKLSVAVTTGDVSGKLIGLRAKHVGGGVVDIALNVDEVKPGAVVTGAEIGTYGSKRAKKL